MFAPARGFCYVRSAMDKSMRIQKLGAMAGRFIRNAENHEAKAREARRRAQQCSEEIQRHVGDAAEPAVRRRPTTKGRAPLMGQAVPESPNGDKKETGAPRQGVTASDRLAAWAHARGDDFSFSAAMAYLEAIKVSAGPFYHLVKKGILAKVGHGKYIHADLLPTRPVTHAGLESSNGAEHLN